MDDSVLPGLCSEEGEERTMNEKYTLREAVERLAEITDEIASLLGVAAADMGCEELEEHFHVFPDENALGHIETSERAHRFAEMLVMRIVADGPLGFTWDGDDNAEPLPVEGKTNGECGDYPAPCNHEPAHERKVDL